MMEAAFGPQNPFVAQALFNYAELLESTGQPADAVPLAERALDILRNRAPDHPNVAASLWQIARLREELGDLTSPRQLYEDMLQISERAQVGNPASMEFGRADYARYLARVGDDALAFDHAIRAERASRDLVRHVLRALPERQAALFAASHRVALDASLAVLAHSRQVVPAETAAAFDAVVRSRAIVLDEMAARRRAAASTPAVTRLQHDLNETRSRLARIVVRGQDEMAAPAYAAQVREALAAKERAEQTLAGASAAFRAERQDAATGFADVRAALPPASALVSYVQYEASTQRGVAETRFGAFVLRQGDDAPAFVALGLAKEIDAVASAARDQIVREAEAPGVSPLRAEQRYREAASALRRLVWDPIASAVAGRARIFIVADGALHLVNFSALPVGVDRYLIDRGLSLHYLSAERDLVSRPESHVNHGLLALGNPAFGRASVNQSTGHPPARPSVASDRGAGAACSGLEGMRFDPLPGSAAEASAVASLWRTLGSHDEAFGSVLPLRLATASKAAFKLHAPGQRVLHLATHGFAIPERCARSGSDALSTVVQENPLLLSGLALAGANRRHAESGDEDGILTAEEIAALDLEGVEWAVLSACGTGLGTVRAGEGVFGLRRAFRIAGAATVIMSLWPIDDQATLRWMDDLYRHRFVARLSTMDSIRQTSLDALRQRRTARASTHPYYWAGFVAVGEWR